jgi:hypothetical protein
VDWCCGTSVPPSPYEYLIYSVSRRGPSTLQPPTKQQYHNRFFSMFFKPMDPGFQAPPSHSGDPIGSFPWPVGAVT